MIWARSFCVFAGAAQRAFRPAKPSVWRQSSLEAVQKPIGVARLGVLDDGVTADYQIAYVVVAQKLQQFGQVGDIEYLKEYYGLTAENIRETCIEMLKMKK